MARLDMVNVSKVYGEGDQTVTALQDATLTAQAGELVALVGPSGSGKTTFLAIAGSLLHPTGGRVAVDGRDLTGLPAAALARHRLEHVGFVLQSSNLIPSLVARDQLLLVARLAGRDQRQAASRADALLDAVGLAKRSRHYPEALSGGERQRVAIARALMNDPDLLLADEPTANLDSARGREIVAMLAHEVRSRGKAAVMVTHDERVLDLCDRVVHIADGRLLDAGPPTA